MHLTDVQNETRLAKLEWEFLPLLDRHSSETRPVTLVRQLQSSPALLVDLLIAIYRADGDNSGDDDDVEISEAAFRRAQDLLERFDAVPGRNSDGSIDASVFNPWIDEVRTLSEAAKRRVVCDLFLGKLLATVPIELQTNSGFRVVARALERISSKELLDGYHTGLFNSRGVTTRMPTDGGRLERGIADRYRTIARDIRVEFPSVAAVFDSVVRHYEREGKSNDVIAERRQLGR